MPLLVLVGSIEPTTFFSGVAAAVAAAVLAYILKKKPTSTLYGGRNGAVALGVVVLFALISTGQEVRRCATALCSSPTMYGTEADCRAPCYTFYGQLFHWPAVGFSVIGLLGSGRAVLRFLALVEAVEALPPPLQPM